MPDGPGAGPRGTDRDLDMVFAGVDGLRELASGSEAEDGGRIYDFSIRWGTLMSGRLKRLEHYYRAGDLTDEQAQRYRDLRRELRDAMRLAESLGVSRPTVPLED